MPHIQLTCPVCKGTDLHISPQKRLPTGLPTNIQLFRCEDCQGDFFYPREEMNYKEILPEFRVYTTLKDEDIVGQVHHTLKATSHWKDSPMVYHLMAGMPKRGTFLDFGAGSGYMSVIAQELGYEVSVVEPNPLYQKFITRHLPKATLVSSFDELGEAEFDLIMAMHVIEHLGSPVDMLHDFKKHLKPDGICVIVVPNADRSYYRFGEQGRELENQQEWNGFADDFPPHHLTRFRAHTLMKALQQAGFEAVSCDFSPLTAWELFYAGLGDEHMDFKKYSADITQYWTIAQAEKNLNHLIDELHLQDLSNNIVALASLTHTESELRDKLSHARQKTLVHYIQSIETLYQNRPQPDAGLAERDRAIENLQKTMEEREDEIKNLQVTSETLRQKIASDTASFEQQFSDKDAYVESMKQALVQKETEVVQYQQSIRDLETRNQQSIHEQETQYQQSLRELETHNQQSLHEQEMQYQQSLREQETHNQQSMHEQEVQFQQSLREQEAHNQQSLRELETHNQQSLRELETHNQQSLHEQEMQYQQSRNEQEMELEKERVERLRQHEESLLLQSEGEQLKSELALISKKPLVRMEKAWSRFYRRFFMSQDGLTESESDTQKNQTLLTTFQNLPHVTGVKQKGHGTAPYAICTIVSKNYLSYARVLTNSFLRLHPNSQVFMLLADKVDDYFVAEQEPFTLVSLDELNIPHLPSLAFKYNIVEFNTAVKPFFMEYLLKKYSLQKLFYFDPDILIMRPIDEMINELSTATMLLTPHILAPIDDSLHPGEVEILQSGTFNLGFLGVASCPETERLFSWWKDRTYDGCWVEPHRGYHFDQKWMDLAPDLFHGVRILRHPGYNVAYWNLNGRKVASSGDEYTVNGLPLVFFHFSGIEPHSIEKISKHQNRFTLTALPELRELFSTYAKLLLDAGYDECKRWPYAFERFTNGVKIPQPASRQLYRELGEDAMKFGNPFVTQEGNTFWSWLLQSIEPNKEWPYAINRLSYALYEIRADVRACYPDVFGANREGFISWLRASGPKEHGLDENFIPLTTQSSTSHHPEKSTLLSSFLLKRLSQTRIIFYRNFFLPRKRQIGLFVKERLFQHPRLFQYCLRVNKRLDAILRPPLQVSPLPETHVTVSATDVLRDVITVSIDPSPTIAKTGAQELPFGVNVAGYIQGEFGVAEVSRSLVRALEAVHIPFVLNNMAAPEHSANDRTFQNFSSSNPFRVNIMNLNADQSSAVVQQYGREYLKGRYNIGRWSWELSSFPAQWNDAFQYFDEIWTISNFCTKAISEKSPIPVRTLLHSVSVDTSQSEPLRHMFGIPEDAFVFLFTFDFLSVFERKNPLGVITSFEQAFADDTHVRLVLKCTNNKYFPVEFALLQQRCENVKNIILFSNHLRRVDLTSLFLSSDAYVSLHRSEGFGYTMAEAMYCGKPVIATSYSGNMDFMNEKNSLLVRHRLVELERDFGPYEKGNVWAEPDLEHASLCMRWVYEHREGAHVIGRQASLDILDKLSPETIGKEILQRLEEGC